MKKVGLNYTQTNVKIKQITAKLEEVKTANNKALKGSDSSPELGSSLDQQTMNDKVIQLKNSKMMKVLKGVLDYQEMIEN